MKKLFLLIAAAIGTTMVMAQDPADLAATSAVQETQNVEVDIMSFPENVLIESMTNSLGQRLGCYQRRRLYLCCSCCYHRAPQQYEWFYQFA